MEDRLPEVYREETGRNYPGARLDDNLVMGAGEMNLLREICGEDELHYQLTRELLSIEKRHKSMLRRAGLFRAVENAFLKNFYDDEEDALERARRRQVSLDAAQGSVHINTAGGIQESLMGDHVNEVEQ